MWCGSVPARKAGTPCRPTTELLYVFPRGRSRGRIPYTVTCGGRTETRTVEVPNNYMLEAERLSRCVLNGEAPKVTKEFSLQTARVTDRILSAVGY